MLHTHKVAGSNPAGNKILFFPWLRVRITSGSEIFWISLSTFFMKKVKHVVNLSPLWTRKWNKDEESFWSLPKSGFYFLLVCTTNFPICLFRFLDFFSYTLNNFDKLSCPLVCKTPPWRNRLARSAVNRKVGGSSPPGGGKFFQILNMESRKKYWPWQDSNLQSPDS